MNRITKVILGSSVFALSTMALINAPMAAAPDGTGPGKNSVAHGGRMHGGFPGTAPLITIALNHRGELNLTGDQVANLEKIKSGFQNQVAPLHQLLRSIEKEIATSMRQSPANLIQVKTKIQEAEKLRSELRYLQLEALENGKSVLTQQQNDQLKTLLRARHEHFRGRGGQPS